MNKKKKGKNNDIKQVCDALVMVLQFGINMLVPIFICTFLGVWLGNKFDINWLAIPLFFVGAIAGGNNIYKMSKKFIESNDKK
mgnify:CR=1